MNDQFLISYYDPDFERDFQSSLNRLQRLKRLLDQEDWALDTWPDQLTAPNVNAFVRSPGNRTLKVPKSPAIAYLAKVLARSVASEKNRTATLNLVSSLLPYLKDGTFSNLSLTLPNSTTLAFSGGSPPSVRVDQDYLIPLEAEAFEIKTHELLQDLEYAHDLRVKFASLDQAGRYISDADEEYQGFLDELPSGWNIQGRESKITTRSGGDNRAFHLRCENKDIAVVEHETGIEILIAVGTGLATTAIYDLVKWSLKKWRERRKSMKKERPILIEIETIRRGPDGELLGSEMKRIRASQGDAQIKAGLESLLDSLPIGDENT